MIIICFPSTTIESVCKTMVIYHLSIFFHIFTISLSDWRNISCFLPKSSILSPLQANICSIGLERCLTLCMLGIFETQTVHFNEVRSRRQVFDMAVHCNIFSCFILLSSSAFFQGDYNFSKNYFRNTIRVSNKIQNFAVIMAFL